MFRALLIKSRLVTDWTDSLTPSERNAWDKFVNSAARELVQALDRCSVVMSLVPAGPPDIKFCVELGASIMMGKPVIALAVAGAPVPEKLRLVADAVLEVASLETDAGKAELTRQITPVLEKLGISQRGNG